MTEDKYKVGLFYITTVLFSRYHSDFEAFNEWKERARERLHAWRDHMNAAEQEADTLSQFHHFIVSQLVILIIHFLISNVLNN